MWLDDIDVAAAGVIANRYRHWPSLVWVVVSHCAIVYSVIVHSAIVYSVVVHSVVGGF